MTNPQSDPLLDKLERVRQEYLKLVKELSDIPQSFASASGEAGWSEPLDAWWHRNRDKAHAEVADVYEKLVEHGSILFRLAEKIARSAPNSKPGEETELLALLEAYQRAMSEALGALAPRGAGRLSPMSDLLDAWRHSAGDLFGIPPNPLSAFAGLHRSADRDAARQAAASLLNPATVALPKMTHRDAMTLVESLVEYQDRFNRFARLVMGAAADAITRMHEEQRRHSDDDPRGIRDLYAQWLECCELAYDELARDDEFAESLSGLVNSAVRFRAARQKYADAAATAMGMPSREQVRSLSRALHDTRRSLRRVERAGQGSRDLAEAASGSKLRGETTTSDRRPSATSTPAVATSKKATRKKTAKKAVSRTVKKKTATKKVAKKATSKKTSRKKAAAVRSSASRTS
ncbi:MAG: hypothetical protein DWQ08_12865 [Proteobacteria bacterium]|nr:MAG: hypothetical protein DWQ08_12865 [Pseudomonadota bacterium]